MPVINPACVGLNICLFSQDDRWSVRERAS
jgi:hypothetical protein